MSVLQKIVTGVLAALLLASLYGLWHTAAAPTPVLKAADAANTNVTPVIDQNTLITAQRLARLAETPEEQPLAQQALQLADHELDLAFSGALRHLEAHPPTLSAEAQQIQARLTAAQKQLASATDQVNRLKTQLEKAAEADKPGVQDQLDLAQSQLELQQDEVAEAEHDLLDAGGNVHQRIQQAQAEHAAAEKNASMPPPKASSSLSILHGMVEQVRQWWGLREKRHWILEAQERASESAEQLVQTRHNLAEEVASTRQQLGGAEPPPAAAPALATAAAPADAGAPGASPPSLLSMTRQAAADQRRLTLRDQRISARRKLADVYDKWADVVAIHERAALHACLGSAAIILAALLVLLYADRWVGGLIARTPIIDRRQLGALRSVVGVALQIVGILVIVFVLVGRPGQLGTMIGLATAGLTVALKGFIVSFLGWFVLMGRNGIRIGDWVEINGVSGEVVELGMFHTVLRETGNWTDAGHPTGRQRHLHECVRHRRALLQLLHLRTVAVGRADRDRALRTRLAQSRRGDPEGSGRGDRHRAPRRRSGMAGGLARGARRDRVHGSVGVAAPGAGRGRDRGALRHARERAHRAARAALPGGRADTRRRDDAGVSARAPALFVGHGSPLERARRERLDACLVAIRRAGTATAGDPLRVGSLVRPGRRGHGDERTAHHP